MEIKAILEINSKIYVPNIFLDFYLCMPQFLTDFKKKTWFE